jgi:hypothetical protein
LASPSNIFCLEKKKKNDEEAWLQLPIILLANNLCQLQLYLKCLKQAVYLAFTGFDGLTILLKICLLQCILYFIWEHLVAKE